MRVTLFGLPVDILSHDETVERILMAMASGQRCQHVAINVAKLINARTNAELENDIRASDIVGIDGMGIAWALRLFGYEVPHRVAGVDLFEGLMAQCASRGLKPFLLGATPAVLSAAKRKLLRRYPSLELAGSHHGYFSRNRKVRSAISSAPAMHIACSLPCRRRARSDSCIAIAMHSVFRSSWASAARSMSSPDMCGAHRLWCNAPVSSGPTA